MRNSAIILAALLMAMPTFAIAQTDSEIDESCPSDARDMLGGDRDPPPKWLPLEQCEKASQEKYADTAHCYLRIDGKVIINRMCRIAFSQQLRAFNMEVGGGWNADVWMKWYYCRRKISDTLRYSLYAAFEKGARYYGKVELVSRGPEPICFANKRFRMCFSQPYLICAPPDL
jgi:hypothetical protein